MITSKVLKPITLGAGTTIQRNTLTQNLTGATLEHVQNQLRVIGMAGAKQQEAIGNPVSMVQVDGYTSKQMLEAKRRIVILFGNAAPTALMTAIESELVSAISKRGLLRTGALRNVTGMWEWTLMDAELTTFRKVRPGVRFTLRANDRLVLRPSLDYATVVNQAVAGSGRRMKQFPLRRTKRDQSDRPVIGFFGETVQKVRRMSISKQFYVYSVTSFFTIPGERARVDGKPGTQVIVIRPKSRTKRSAR